MSYTPPTSPLNASWVGAPTYRGPTFYIRGSWVDPAVTQWVVPNGLASMAMGSPVAIPQQKIFATAGDQAQFGVTYALTERFYYRPPQYSITASWVGKPAYGRTTTGILPVSWSARVTISPAPWESLEFGAPTIIQQQFVAPTGWNSNVWGDIYAIFPWQYAPPRWFVNASWIGKPAYAYPSSPLNAAWQIPIGPTNIAPTGWMSSDFGAHYLYNLTQYIVPTGLLSLAMGPVVVQNGASGITATGIAPGGYGTAWISNWIRYLTPSGLASQAFGSTAVTNGNRFLLPTGTSMTLWGTPLVKNFNAQAYPGGIAPPSQSEPVNSDRQIPNPRVSFFLRTLAPNGIFGTVVPSPIVTHITQYLDLTSGRGIAPGVVGSLQIYFRDRTVSPVAIVGPLWGTTIVKRQYYITPAGWDSSFLSNNAELYINTQIIYVLTGAADPAGYGVADVKNFNTLVSTTGWFSQEISSPVEKVFNRKQIIVVPSYADNTDPTGWTNFYPFVENKKRVLGTFGHIDSKVSLSAWIFNKGMPIRPVGSDLTEWGAETFISHKNRTVIGQGWDSFYNTQYTVVYNAAKVIAPPSLGDTSRLGRPNPVLNLNRTVIQHSGWVGPEIGTAYIDFGVRTLRPAEFLDVPNGIPEVRFNPHPFVPPSIGLTEKFGGHNLHVHFNQFFPFSLNVHSPEWVGEPFITNRNKTLFQAGRDSSEFGRATIENYIKYITPEGFTPLVFGVTLIEKRTKTVVPSAVSPPSIPVIHRIYKDSPDPPSLQRIDLSAQDGEGEETDGEGIGPGVMGSLRIRLATIYPTGWANLSSFGTHKVYSNNIRPFTIFEDALFGTPSLNVDQWVYPDGFSLDQTTSDGLNRFGSARFTPWNIYGPVGDARPAGYRPFREGHAVGSRNNSSFDFSAYPWFGRTDVQHKNRILRATGKSSSLVFGTAVFTLRRRYILPLGTRFTRFGFPVFWGVAQYITLDADFNHNGIDSMVFGPTTVAHYIDPNAPKIARPTGLASQAFGVTRVEYFNRTITATGIPHRGNPQQGDTSPWGIPLVGFPRRYTIGMGVQTRWGNNAITHKIRNIYPEGWTNLSLDNPSYEDFEFPMKVTRKNPKASPVGISSVNVFGACTITHFERTVYGRGIDSYNTGTHAVKASLVVGPEGWLSEVFGDIDRWEAGKIKAHGDDLSTVGTPRILSPLRPDALFDGVVAAPRIAPGISPLGFMDGPFVFNGPTVSNPFGCTNRAVVPLPILSAMAVPSPVVT